MSHIETFSGSIRDLTAMGLGVVDHPEGRAFFVQGTWPGDKGLFQVDSREKKYGFATLLELHEASPDREENPCRHSGFQKGQCGGCSWLGIKYEKQLEQKQKIVEYLLSRNAPDESTVVNPIWASPKIFGYRNRAQLKTEGKHIGYVSPGSKVLAPIQDCLVLSGPNRQTLHDLQKQLPQNKWIPRRPYLWNFIEIDENVTAETMQLNKKTTFKQANTEQNFRMQKWLSDKFEPVDKSLKVTELFCGSGNFTEIISESGFENIIATELDSRAVTQLSDRKLPGVKAIVSDLFYENNWKSTIDAATGTQILVLDPPREGFKGIEKFCDQLPKLERIFYISCDAARFFNEVKILKNHGWRLKEVQPVDQFPHTPHVELLAELERIYDK